MPVKASAAHALLGGNDLLVSWKKPAWNKRPANRMIRRFIPKGCDTSKLARRQIRKVGDWMNNCSRKILDFETAEERFIRELAA